PEQVRGAGLRVLRRLRRGGHLQRHGRDRDAGRPGGRRRVLLPAPRGVLALLHRVLPDPGRPHLHPDRHLPAPGAPGLPAPAPQPLSARPPSPRPSPSRGGRGSGRESRMVDSWSVATPEAAGMDAAVLGGIAGRVRSGELANVHAVLVARHGTLLLEQYFAGP